MRWAGVDRMACSMMALYDRFGRRCTMPVAGSTAVATLSLSLTSLAARLDSVPPSAASWSGAGHADVNSMWGATVGVGSWASEGIAAAWTWPAG